MLVRNVRFGGIIASLYIRVKHSAQNRKKTTTEKVSEEKVSYFWSMEMN